jgi:hypothetical protein
MSTSASDRRDWKSVGTAFTHASSNLFGLQQAQIGEHPHVPRRFSKIGMETEH